MSKVEAFLTKDEEQEIIAAIRTADYALAPALSLYQQFRVLVWHFAQPSRSQHRVVRFR